MAGCNGEETRQRRAASQRAHKAQSDLGVESVKNIRFMYTDTNTLTQYTIL